MTIVPKGLYNTSFFVVMNQARWDSLDDADRLAIESVSGEAFARMAGRAWDRADTAGMAAIGDLGIAVTRLTGEALEELHTRVAFAEEQWIGMAKQRGVDGEAALRALRAEIGRER